MTKHLLTATLLLAGLWVGTAQAVEKTAVDKRLSAPLDVDIQSLQTFLQTLTSRIEKDLGNKVVELQGEITMYNDLLNRLEDRINLINSNFNANGGSCGASLTPYDPTRALPQLAWHGVNPIKQPETC